MKKYLCTVRTLLLLLNTFLWISGCKGERGKIPSKGGNNSITIQHESGETILKSAPERIVVLEYSFIDALAAVNVAPVGIADDKIRDRIVPELTGHIGNDWVSVGTRKQPSIEVIASLNPDLIIADKKRHSAVYSSLSQVSPTIVLDSLGSNYDATIANMYIIAKALGKEKEMQERIAEHQKVMDDYVQSIQNENNLTAQFGVTNANGLWLHGPASFAGSILQRLGYSSRLTNTEDAYIETSLEQLAEANPDILLFGKYADPALTDQFPKDALWQTINAVQNNSVAHVTAHTWSRLRGIISAEMMAQEFVTAINGK